MNKGKNFNSGQTTVEALGASIVSFLLQEGKVVIPELGYLELKKFSDKQTVLFKATENTTLFLASEGSIQSHIYDHVSVPLREGKVVTLPDLGIFRPMKNTDGSYRISFTISSAFRKLLNETTEGTNEVKPADVPLTLVKVADEKVHAPVVESVIETQSVEVEKEKVEKAKETEGGEDEKKVKEEKKAVREEILIKESIKNKVEHKETEGKEKDQGRVIIAAPKREIKVERKIPAPVVRTSKVGDLVVPQEDKERYVIGLGRIIAAIAALVVLVFIVWYFLPENKNRNNQAFTTANGKPESAQLIDQSNESGKSYELIDLPSLAERKYGNRIFWVYIYEANRDKISSPVNIPTGINLRIPNLWDDFKVDVMDSLEIKRAGILSDIILKKQKLQL